MADDRSCWTCGYCQHGGMTFLGICKYFETIGKPAKDIPPSVVDVGCRYWKKREPRKIEVAGSV
jgi:hypothetical protein